mgnify:CR=1 FL=1
MSWYASGKPQAIIQTELGPKVHKSVKGAVASRARQIGQSKTKGFSITPVGIDKSFVTTLNNSLRTNYIAAAANRRVSEDE